MAKYAANTDVSVSSSKAEIERIVERYGATGFMSGWTAEQAVVAFSMERRQVRFVLTMPNKADPAFTQFRHSSGNMLPRTESSALAQWEQACRQRWRALALVVKAKLEAVDAGISTFESEFLANIVLPGGRTVAEHAIPAIALAYDTGSMQPLLPDYSQGDQT